MIPQSFIQDLLARVDIVEVVGRHVRLKKGGANWLGLCPFHGEKSPSFTVSPAKQFYHCFGCGAHGSAIGFLMEHGGLGYVDAIHDLARGAGLAVPDDGGPGERRRQDPDLLETLALAARFYKRRLKDCPAAIDYLKARGVSGETAARFGLGYAPDSWRGLEAAVPDYAATALVESGLVIESEPDVAEPGRKRRYDRFRDRIMFPIRSPRGLVIGFGGRVLGAGEPKYLNSPETPLFSKGRELYGLFEGRDALRAANCAIVVEGYMDVVMLAQHGVRNAVATLGTATTPQHVQKLLRLVDRVVFSFDGDGAGRRAAWRALEACLPHAGDTQRIDFLFLPPEHDPDSFVRAHGAGGFGEALAAAQPLSEFLLRGLAGRVDLATPEGRARYQAEARPLLRALPRAALRLQLVQAVAGKVGVRAEDLQSYLDGAPAEPGGGPADAARRRGDGPRLSGPEPVRVGWAGAAAGGAGRTEGPPERTVGWRGGRPQESRWRTAPRPMPVALPDLQRRVRLLLALHPPLAREAWPSDFLPEPVTGWFERLRALPPEATFAQLLESLRHDQDDLASALQAEAARDPGLLAELGVEEARREVAGALNQLRSQRIREEVDQLASTGLGTEPERERYAWLQALRRSLTTPTGS